MQHTWDGDLGFLKRKFLVLVCQNLQLRGLVTIALVSTVVLAVSIRVEVRFREFNGHAIRSQMRIG